MFFTVLGVWIALQLVKPKVETLIVEKEVFIHSSDDMAINESELKKLNLSTREYEVLQLLTKGQSNAEIAENLFLSLSTVKTHVSNLFVKMDVKSRAQAIEKAKAQARAQRKPQPMGAIKLGQTEATPTRTVIKLGGSGD